MACCGSRRGETKKYRLVDPSGTVHIYLTEPELRIGLATHGGGTWDTITTKDDRPPGY